MASLPVIAAEGGYQEFTLKGGEWAVLLLSAAAALLALFAFRGLGGLVRVRVIVRVGVLVGVRVAVLVLVRVGVA